MTQKPATYNIPLPPGHQYVNIGVIAIINK